MTGQPPVGDWPILFYGNQDNPALPKAQCDVCGEVIWTPDRAPGHEFAPITLSMLTDLIADHRSNCDPASEGLREPF